jgi:hypothetical protein
MRQELGDPLRILDVGLASGHGFDMLRIEQPDREDPLEEGIDRFPLVASALKAHMGATTLPQPVREAQQLG